MARPFQAADLTCRVNGRIVALLWQVVVNRTIVVSASLLCFPAAFLLSAAMGHAIWPSVLGNPLLLLTTAMAALALALRRFIKLEVNERSIQFSFTLPPLANMAITMVAISIVTVVLGYGFLENFAPR